MQRYSGSGYIYSSGGDGAFWAPVTLPAGSLVTQTCVWLYDSTANNIRVEMAIFLAKALGLYYSN